MDAEFRPLSLQALQDAAGLNPALLLAARRHVGAAGIEQTAALERLIAAAQEHAGLTLALLQVSELLRQSGQAGDAERVQPLLAQSRDQAVILEELARVVTGALAQITATPVQRISAEVLEAIAGRMHGQVTALEQLIDSIERSEAVPGSYTPDLEAIQERLQQELAQVAAGRRLGQLDTLHQLAVQATRDIARMEALPHADRRAALHAVLEDMQRQLHSLDA